MLLTDMVTRAAKQARHNPVLIAWALARYQRVHRLTMASLAAWLGLTPAQLAPLALCRRPESELACFAADIRRLVAVTGCDGLRLTALLREVEADAAGEASAGSWPRQQRMSVG